MYNYDDVDDYKEDILDILGMVGSDIKDCEQDEYEDKGCPCGGCNCMDCLGMSYKDFM